MASAKGLRIARAFVELFADDSKLKGDLRRAQRTLRNSAAGFIGAGKAIGIGTGAAFLPIGIGAVKAAGDALEITNKFNQTFGNQADEAAGFAEDLADRIGRSSTRVKESLSSYQAFFVGLGFEKGAALELSEEVQKLSLDFASFNNLSDGEGQRRFISALAGSSEVLDRFGVNTKEAALQQELIRLNMSKTVRAATEQQKVAARLSIIFRSLSSQGAVGDAERTQSTFVNSLKRLTGEVFETAVAIGKALLPAVTAVVRTLSGIARVVRKVAQENPKLILTLTAIGLGLLTISGLLIGLGLVLALAGAAVGGFVAAFSALATAVGATVAAISGAIGAIGVVLSPAVLTIGLLTAAFVGWLFSANETATAIRAIFGDLKNFLFDVFGGMFDAIAAGDFKLAGEILINGLSVAWVTGLSEITGFFGLAMDTLVLAFSSAVSFMKKLWADFAANFSNITNRATTSAAKGFVGLLNKTGLVPDAVADSASAVLDASKANRTKEIESTLAARLAGVEKEKKELDDGVFAGQDLRLKSREEALETERKKLAASIAQAKLQRSEDKKNNTDFTEVRGGIIDTLIGLLGGAKKGTASAAGDVRSTFSAAEARRFGGAGSDSVAARAAQSSEKSAALLDRIERELSILHRLATFA